jgi:hypothetical protein
MVVAVDVALAVLGVKLRVLADKRGAGTVEKRRGMEGFSELEEWGAGLEDDGAGIILSFRIRVDSELE